MAVKITELLVSRGSCVSFAQARRFVKSGGVKVNGEYVYDIDLVIDEKTQVVSFRGEKK